MEVEYVLELMCKYILFLSTLLGLFMHCGLFLLLPRESVLAYS